VLAQLGTVVLALAALARLAGLVAMSPVPLYLLAGLVIGHDEIVGNFGEGVAFIETAAHIGVLLLLFMLGLEYSAQELFHNLRANGRAGAVDLALNATPGVVTGLLLGWRLGPALALGGVTYVSSSGIVSKAIGDLGWLGNRETPVVLSILVIEDLAMALFLPIIAGLVAGSGAFDAGVDVAIALAVVVVVLLAALRLGPQLSRVLFSHSDEVFLLTALGVTLLAAALAEHLHASGPVVAFLLGTAFSGPAADSATKLLTPLRDLFAGAFFIFFGLQIDPAAIPPVLPEALALAVVTAATKVATGWWAAGRAGVRPFGRLRAGMLLTARGEFSIVIAGLAVAGAVADPLGPLAAAYVLMLAVGGPILARMSDPIARRVLRSGAPRPAPVR
jgi:monovalent cation:H+ antiporter-2, CPA2 family